MKPNGVILLTACIVTFGCTIGMGAHAQSAHAHYLSELAELRSAGIPTSLAEIYPASAPDDQNAAPIYVKLGDKQAFPSTQAETDALKVLDPSPTDADWRNAKSFLDANRYLVNTVHQAASMPVCVVPGRATAADPAAILFPELASIRRAARIIAIESVVLAHDGKYKEAAKNAGLGFQLADHGYGTPNLIGWLVGVAVDAITINDLQHIMIMGRNDSSVIDAVDTAVNDNWTIHPVAKALAGEAASTATEIECLRRSGPGKPTDAGTDSDQPTFPAAVYSSPAAWSDFVDANGSVALNYFGRLIAASEESYPTASKEAAELDSEVKNFHGDDTALAGILCPVFSKCVDKQADIESRIAILHASAFVMKWKNVHQAYPGSLETTGGIIPVDPFDQKAIKYRAENGGFVLYSVGGTGKFDGGAHQEYENVFRLSNSGVGAWK
jgi:hypothetical protein